MSLETNRSAGLLYVSMLVWSSCLFQQLSVVFQVCVLSRAEFQWLSQRLTVEAKETKARKTTLNPSGSTFPWTPLLVEGFPLDATIGYFVTIVVFRLFLLPLTSSLCSLIRYNTAPPPPTLF